MKKILTVIGILSFVTVHSQDLTGDPTHWSFSTKKLEVLTYELHIMVTLDKDWHIYSQTQPKESICVPASIKFSPNPLITMVGKPKEIGNRLTFQNKAIKIKQYQFAERVEFVQVVKLKSPVKTNIAGGIKYQVCTEEKCLPEKTKQFTINLD